MSIIQLYFKKHIIGQLTENDIMFAIYLLFYGVSGFRLM